MTSSLKERVRDAIAARAAEVIALAEEVYRHPELGFKEVRTSALMAERLAALGLEPETGLALTGVRAVLDFGRSGPTVAVMGELDAVVCFPHPEADPHTGAVHACGHHGQLAALWGAAVGLTIPGLAPHLSGRVVFWAVPAEEYVEIEYRQRLRREGKISFLGGKQELIARGLLDDVDLAMLCHADSDNPGRKAKVGGTCNGFIGKLATFEGKEAHAGGAPHQGVNALNAAILGIMGIHCQRETFRDEDHVRVHPILTRGGDLVNIVPADVRLETYVRAATTEAMADANRKVNRALRAGGLAVGARVHIEDLPGYLPMRNDPNLSRVFADNLALLIGPDNISCEEHVSGSTDMGDVSHLIPAIHPSLGGVAGRAHARDFRVVDAEMAYVIPAQAMAMTVVDLLANGAAAASGVMAQFRPAVPDREEYVRLWERLTGTEEVG
ncbi:MAG: amidohydrolase [Bacillota bacterium]|nr:amidohydrolase [Bacillota bacterium]MDI7248640.1 amidohydrolase [Bacillota bacterium]